MSEVPFVEDPPRLADQDGPIQAVMRLAEPAFREGLSASTAWGRLRRRQRRRQRSRAWSVAALGAAAAAAAGFYVSRPEPPPLRLAREPVVIPSAPPKPAPPAPTTSATVDRALPPAPPRVQAPAVPRPGPTLAEAALSDGDCRKLAEAGQLERAVGCFEVLGQGSGLRAQVALHEAARLAADELHDPERAMRSIEQFRARFSGGTLWAEVETLRIALLERLGRSDEALAASERLLATPAGRMVGQKLRLLRGRIYERVHQDCGKAITEYVALLGEAGAEGDAAELGRAKCLETLGRHDDAASAYQRYLERPDPKAAAHARQRLLELEAGKARSGD